jgi:hypothetical protein
MALTIYTFSGQAFYRMVDGYDFQPWLEQKTTYQADPILGGATGATYIDIAATVIQPFTVRAAFSSEVNRQAMKAKIATSATLSNTSGRSRAATLVSVTEIGKGIGGYFIADLVFLPN